MLKRALRTGCLIVILSAGVSRAGPLVLHPSGEALPFEHQGPFVTTGVGGVLCIDAHHAHFTRDEGKTWESVPLFREPEKFEVTRERALLRTRQGVVVAAFMNLREQSSPPGHKWGGSPEEFAKWVLPIYICRSLDDGRTWEAPQKLNQPWCGCIHSMIETAQGRIVLVGQEVLPAWRHGTVMFVSDDQGRTWKRSNMLDIGEGRHDHAGSIEGTIVERSDNTLYQLLRTETGWLYESTSSDGGLNWTDLLRSPVRSVACCAQMGRLADGRIALLWNHPPRIQPDHKTSREELAISFSADDARTWSQPKVIAARFRQAGDKADERRVSYPYLYERAPGELWITTMQGGLRMRIRIAGIDRGEVPLPPSIVMFGDSTTAFRPGQVKQVYSERVSVELLKRGAAVAVANRGVGGNTTENARQRFEKDVLSLRPRLVVIQFGLNDSAVDVWKHPDTVPRVSIDRYEANLRWMIDQSRAAGSRVILMTTNPARWTDKMKELYGKPPYNPADPEGFEKPHLRAYNTIIRNVAEQTDVPLVDVHAAFADAAKAGGRSVDSLLLDGVHPNDDGHQIVTEHLLPAIRRVLGDDKN